MVEPTNIYQSIKKDRKNGLEKMKGGIIMASRGEIKIKEILEMNQIKFAREYIFPELVSTSGRPLRFDFAVF